MRVHGPQRLATDHAAVAHDGAQVSAIGRQQGNVPQWVAIHHDQVSKRPGATRPIWPCISIILALTDVAWRKISRQLEGVV